AGARRCYDRYMPVSEEARAVHFAATAIDLHADTPKLISRGYDIARRHTARWPLSRFFGHVDLPRMKEGGLAAQFFGLWTFPYPQKGCARDIHRQLDALEQAAAASEGALELARSADDVRAAHVRGARVGLRGIEGGQALEGELSHVEAYARRG